MSVLVVISRKAGVLPLARLGYRFARALEQRLVVLCLERGLAGDEPLHLVPGEEIPDGTSQTVADVCEALARRPHEDELLSDAEEHTGRVVPDPEVEVVAVRAPKRLPAVLEQIEASQADVLIAAKHKTKGREVTLARKLFTAAPCHTVLVRLAEAEEACCERILVPTAGGPHASVALRLAERLASVEDGEVVALYVGSYAGELAEEVGERILEGAIREAGLSASTLIVPRVELANDRFEAIQRVAHEEFDLLLLGDSNAGSLRRSLFGTVPEHLLSKDGGMQIAVVRREWKLFHRLRKRLGRWLDLTIPQMARGERIALYEKLQSGSEWNFDFMALIALSTAIAALGLLQDSAAVVIGAMLVAPLMTPILGAGLALVQGNAPLLRSASKAITLGYLVALLIGLLLGNVFQIPELTQQLAARGGPTLLDMGVGFLSGVAAAFCLGRPGLLAALPGVAIAAALVPPIATTGVCLALGERANAWGAALLLGTNVVAIILGAAMSLYAIGVRGRSAAASHQRWVRNGFLALMVGAVALAFPLGSGLVTQLTGGEARVPAELEQQISAQLAETSGARLVDLVDPRDGKNLLEIGITASRPLSDEQIQQLVTVVRQQLGEDWAVRIDTRLEVVVP
ncbi:MAG: DUF389 domain-containing protein [Acidobacteriota bacterium]